MEGVTVEVSSALRRSKLGRQPRPEATSPAVMGNWGSRRQSPAPAGFARLEGAKIRRCSRSALSGIVGGGLLGSHLYY